MNLKDLAYKEAERIANKMMEEPKEDKASINLTTQEAADKLIKSHKTSKVSKDILAGLEPLFREAKEKGHWFYESFHQVWFSPEELRAEHANGKFIWSDVNWKLLDPSRKLRQLDEVIEKAKEEQTEFQARIDTWRKTQQNA